MKKIIAGRLYDTETAMVVGVTGYSYEGDFNHWAETLYRKKSGEYFLLGEGGGLSRYAEYVPQCGWTNGSKIKPLTDEEAKEWAMNSLDPDEFMEKFGPVEE